MTGAECVHGMVPGRHRPAAALRVRAYLRAQTCQPNHTIIGGSTSAPLTLGDLRALVTELHDTRRALHAVTCEAELYGEAVDRLTGGGR